MKFDQHEVTPPTPNPVIQPVAFQADAAAQRPEAEPPESLPPLDSAGSQNSSVEILTPPPEDALSLEEVVTSVRLHFPLIRQAVAARGIAAGEALSALGAFDHKLDGFTESQPLDFYQNYRHSIGVKRNTMWGGQTIAGYRIGRGSFEPWYLERETNKGGEFKAGVIAPLIRDRWIDANRAELWQAQLEQRRVEPEIMAQIIMFVRDGSVTYWDWVAAGENYRIADGLLDLALERNRGLQEQVRLEEKASIDLVDNRRIIVSREAKLIDARRKLEQAAVKLSLFYRSNVGEPVLADAAVLPAEFPLPERFADNPLDLQPESEDMSLALGQRPELTELQVVREQLSVALRQARNETLPDVDGGVLVGQDVGEPTSSKRDKSEFELEAMIMVTVPLERRKALGKIRSLQAKMAQVSAKNQFTSDKIVADVRLARAALIAAWQRVDKANESYNLAIRMREAEQVRFELGQSDLFNLNIREQQAAEAAADRVLALFEYYVAQADYAAALGYDGPDL